MVAILHDCYILINLVIYMYMYIFIFTAACCFLVLIHVDLLPLTYNYLACEFWSCVYGLGKLQINCPSWDQ